MSRTTISTIAVLAAGALSIPGSAMGQEASPANSIHIEGAYAYVVNEPDAKGVQVVFKTVHALPRRSSGGIRAGASLGSVTNGYSLSTLRGSKSKNCYVFTSATTSGRVGGPGGKRATVGSKHVLTVRRSDGEHLSDTLTAKRSKRAAPPGHARAWGAEQRLAWRLRAPRVDRAPGRGSVAGRVARHRPRAGSPRRRPVNHRLPVLPGLGPRTSSARA